MPSLDIEPVYFGTGDASLFGCYNPPRSAAARSCGAILCYPMGQEYIRSHRTYRQLATRLAKGGVPVLRFDFSACGDSPGECEEGRIDQWLADLSTAIDEMRKRCGPVAICLVGLRLGGTLAMLAGVKRGDIDGLVLWDPIVNGRAYVEELLAGQSSAMRWSDPRPPSDPTPPTEVLGFPLSDLLRQDLCAIDLLSSGRRPAPHVLVVDGSDNGSLRQLSHFLEGLGTRVEYAQIASPKIWMHENKTVVPHQVLQGVAAWLTRMYP
jgi:uncharacterized protein